MYKKGGAMEQNIKLSEIRSGDKKSVWLLNTVGSQFLGFILRRITRRNIQKKGGVSKLIFNVRTKFGGEIIFSNIEATIPYESFYLVGKDDLVIRESLAGYFQKFHIGRYIEVLRYF